RNINMKLPLRFLSSFAPLSTARVWRKAQRRRVPLGHIRLTDNIRPNPTSARKTGNMRLERFVLNAPLTRNYINPSNRDKTYLILHNIRSLYNVGSIFRTADGAGVSKIYLTGYTPLPAVKTALGAEKYVPWEKIRYIVSLLGRLKKEKVKIIALEQAEGAIDYRKFRPKFPLALVLGNEVRGLSKALLKKCDKIIQIPMRGKKESLNVSVAAGVALFSLIRN
ncbi:MAG: RNA methyltransferase, partial [bacterium]|nr:RNA methyltransferase [bacterium]